MKTNRLREKVFVGLLATGYIILLILAIYLGLQMSQSYPGPPRTPIFEHVLPWGF